MAVKKKKTIPFKFGQKHMDYIYACQFNTYNILEGAVRSGKKEKDMDTHQKLLLETINASLALGEATARAVQRIPDAKCNGDMHAALEYAQKVKHEQKDFLREQALENLHEVP